MRRTIKGTERSPTSTMVTLCGESGDVDYVHSAALVSGRGSASTPAVFPVCFEEDEAVMETPSVPGGREG